MTGLDKILEHIKQDAEQEAKASYAEAEAEAKALVEKAAEEEREFLASSEEKRNSEVALLRARGQSAAELTHRKMLLEAKQKIISDMMEAAKHSLSELSDAEYFDTILKMVSKYAQPQTGEIIFSKKDKQRVPATFIEAVKKYSLTVSDETREIGGGFILLYGEIEENCSFDALFFEAREELQDKVKNLLF